MEKKEKWIKRSVLGSMAALAVMAVVGCAEEITQQFTDRTEVQVTASFSDTGRESLTRAADGLDNSTAGFSLTTSESSSSKVRVMVDANDGTYSPFDYSITNATTMTAPATPPSFPSGVNSVNVYGWYPNVSLTNFSVNANQQSEANYCLSDLMVAAGSTCTRSGSSVTQSANLSFTHVMSKVKVSLTLASGVTVTAVKLKSILPQVTVTEQKTSNAVTSFNLGEASGSATDITLFSGSLTSASAAADKVLCGVFPPQSKNGAFLEINASYNSGAAQTITYSFGSAKAFARANEYTMNITLNGTNVTTSTVDISDWNVESGEVTINAGGGGGDAPTLSPTSLSLTFRSGTGSITPSVVGTAWTSMSANTSVATVSGTGPITVTPAGVGSTTIYVWPTAGVSSGFSTASCPVTVSALTMQTSNSSNNGYTTFSSIADQLYTGSAITPTPTVTVKGSDGNVNLVSGTDFDYSYSNNTAAGTNTATVTVTGKGNYTGSASKTFSIVTCNGSALSSATVGSLICSHGKVHPSSGITCAGTAIAAVAWLGTTTLNTASSGTSSTSAHQNKTPTKGVAIALCNAASQNWGNADVISANGNFTADIISAVTTLKNSGTIVTDWMNLQKTSWEAIGVGSGGYASLNTSLSGVTGFTALSDWYRSTTENGSNGGWVFYDSHWDTNYNKSSSWSIRPVFAF